MDRDARKRHDTYGGGNLGELLSGPLRDLMRQKARKLARPPAFSASDAEDIEQTAYVRLIERLGRLPSGNCSLGLALRIVDQSLANQLRDRLAEKRDPRGVRSLDQVIKSDATSTTLSATIGQEGLDRRRGVESADVIQLSDLGMDVDEFVAQLDKERRELCEALGIESVSELARRFGKPRSTLQDEVRKLRTESENRGLKTYCE